MIKLMFNDVRWVRKSTRRLIIGDAEDVWNSTPISREQEHRWVKK